MTPMMQQYLAVKAQYPDTLLFYRLGDFYEMFFEDAVTASKELELTLTGRDCGEEKRAPMCGVPFHAADSYIARLVSKGYKVAVCEQMEDPATAKDIVKRDVIRVMTPGTVIESSMLDESKNNYLASLVMSENAVGLAFADISTGEVHVTYKSGKKTVSEAENEIARFAPSEIIFNSYVLENKQIRQYLVSLEIVSPDRVDDGLFDYMKAKSLIEDRFGKPLERLSLDDKTEAVMALGGCLVYLETNQKSDLNNITEIDVYNDEKYMGLDAVARRNLELTETVRRRETRGSLLWVLDKTKSAMGKRLLRSYLENPLVNVNIINSRLNCVGELYSDSALLGDVRELLSGVNDFERILTRIVYGTANARELRSLCSAISVIPELKKRISGRKTKLMKNIFAELDELRDVAELIDGTILEDPAFSVREGGMIKRGCNDELDSLFEIVSGGKKYLTQIEEREQEKTGIKKLKIGYNRVFGYYIEVTNSFKDMVPEHYIRKQTLANCERYITSELKELESKVLGAQERITKLEYELFSKVREAVAAEQVRIKLTAAAVAKLDVFCSFAYVALENGYEKPVVNDSDRLIIKDGRHPVVEKFLKDAPFVPNDAVLDCGENRTAIITGPNMAGKSTYMRQIALTVIMAQIGCFVPAKSAEIGIVDKIFTRIGAADDLAMGQSTFMMEMTEVASILNNATKSSLIILDEIGRGTSTYDGMSIAKAVVQYVADKRKIGAKTLFATHYHELTELESSIDGVKNYNIAVKKRGDDITFLRKIVRGGADGSYGIEVAKLAGIPQKVIKDAKEILTELEQDGRVVYITKHDEAPEERGQISFENNMNSAIAEKLRSVDLNTLTPIEALTMLYDLKKMTEN